MVRTVEKPVVAARRLASALRRPLLIALALVLAGGILQGLARQARHGVASDDRALTDVEATDNVIGDVSNGLSKIFSYSPDSLATTQQAAADVLGGRAYGQYKTLFSQVQREAARQRLTLTTRVVQAGVTRLSGDTAHLLVFVDQLIVRKDRPKGTSAAAQLSVTAHREHGHWRIVDIRAR